VGAFAWWILGDGTPSLVGLQYALFGFGAVSYAKHPEGIVEWRKRESLQALLDRRAERRVQASPPPPQPIGVGG
jgi:hypothetical protein